MLPYLSGIIRDGIWLVLVGTAVPLASAGAVGLLVSFIAAVTQVQEQSAVYLAKVCAISFVIWLLGGQFIHKLVDLWRGALNVSLS